jgi:hypothetical protein
MDHQFIARCLLTFLGAVQGVATLAIDLNHTHATNPQWLGHARFHLVWQDMESFLICVLAVALTWWPAHYEQCFYLAAILTAIPMLGFLAAFAGRKLYGGALSDPNGIAPARVAVLGKVRQIDLNLAAVIVGMAALAGILTIYS